MADALIPTPYTDRDDTEYGITLGGVRVLYRLRWWQELSGWYLQLSTDAGAVVSDWHVLTPYATATYDRTAPGHPPGIIRCVGVGNASRRDDLFTSLALIFRPNDG